MARVKIADVGRVHVWDSRLRTPLVSDVHEHPWPLKSTIISGEMLNQRFSQVEEGECLSPFPLPYYRPYYRQTLKTGEGGGLVGEPKVVTLRPHMPEFYCAGSLYVQSPSEIHRSQPQDGTVTLMERPMGPPLQETFVYWPLGMDWVSAEPRRPRNEYELSAIIALALARWEAA